jgi:3-dehydroquinate synthase
LSIANTVKVDLAERSYEITVGAGSLGNSTELLKPFVSGKKIMIITDSNVEKLYLDKCSKVLAEAGANLSSASFTAGESSKHIGTLEKLYSAAVDNGLDRGSLIIALGGGIPGDVAGFAAATYMRGIKFIQVPTTLLAMVDSSVGGKTGIDLPQGKNLVGAFWQPKHVLIDPEVLKTLPEREIRCGLAEVVKYGVIIDGDFFETLEKNIDKLKALDLDFYTEVIAHCCKLKAQVVSEDEREGGLRGILNYGHTFGHAVEAVSGFDKIAHGEGVSIGMRMAADLAVELGMFDGASRDRQNALLLAIGLPLAAPGLDPEKIFAAMFKDKKAQSGKLKLVLPEKLGKVIFRSDIEQEKILAAIKAACV